MDAAALSLALVAALRGPVSTGGGHATALVDAPAGTVVSAVELDGCRATPRGATERAPVTWAIAFDPAFAEKERFRDARQIALYFVSHVQAGDRMNVLVVGPDATRSSGFHGLEDLVALRAPIDSALDPTTPRHDDAGAWDLLSLARSEGRVAPNTPGEASLHVAVAIDGARGGARVRVSGEAVELDEILPPGTSQSRGPRLVAEVAGRLAAVSRAHFDVTCATPEPQDATTATTTTTTSGAEGRTFLIAGAAAVCALLVALVWRAARRG